MAALLSPGVSVTVIDESQYTPTAAGTIPYILLATAQDKLTPSDTIAAGTTAANAESLVTITSQRELISTFGYPTFQQDSSGNPLHANELNEYGLLAAYSALGVANRVYIQRADVDLNELIGTSIRPTGTPADGVYWLDQAFTVLGVHEFSSATGGFTNQIVNSITSTSQLNNGIPISSYGKIGDYATNSTNFTTPIYYKRWDNTWVLVGSDGWKQSQPVITGIYSTPTVTSGSKLVINGATVPMTGTSVSTAAEDITNAAITGVIATVNSVGKLEIRADSTATSTGNVSLADGLVKISLGTTLGGSNTDCAADLGLFTTEEISANVTEKTLDTPKVQFSDYRNAPAWRTTDQYPAPSGSVWFKTTATGNGANWAFKRYDSTAGGFTLLAAPMHSDDAEAIASLDPVGGGTGISAGSLYVKYDIFNNSTATYTAYVKQVAGILKVTGLVPTSPLTLIAGNTFRIGVSVPGTSAITRTTVVLSGTTVQDLVADVLAKNLPNLSVAVESSGAVSFSHLAGGLIEFTPLTGGGTPLTTIGITGNDPALYVQKQYDTDGSTVIGYLASPWTPLLYTFSSIAPYSNPDEGTLWYYNNPLDVDIMIQSGNGWKGYHNVTNDARGYDLSVTDVNGPILSATAPTTQSDGNTNLVPGDLWIDTGDLENYPVIRRYNGSAWELIDNTDQISADGILFADARWSHNGTTDIIVDALPEIVVLSNSDYLDDDAPEYQLYPRGTLLFNTRRSGYNVKKFVSAHHAVDTLVPTKELSAWVSWSGQDINGVPYMGHKAQRNTIVEALKASIESSVALREEQTEFNLMCCPGYPELIQNMVTLNNDRKNTAFIIGDSPLTLNSNSTLITEWATNANLAEDNGDNGLVTTSEYLGVYYPSGFATNLDGNSVVVPPSHAMLRTFIRSDNQSYPWFAPAGVRRGVLDNISAIGYVDTADGNTFKSIGVTVGLRDVLYTNRVNPLTVLPGVGLVAYGQKSRAATTSAMDRINVARLICYLRLVLDKVARPFIFEPNDTITRNQVKSSFEAVLNDVVAKRGIYDYLVVCDSSNNTNDRIDRNELYIDIAIEPVKAIEFIYIPVRLKGTGGIAAGL